jgi:flagellar hook-associated protein 2
MSTTSSASSATITSLGVGSGLDANAIVSKLVDLERQPITTLQTRADKIQTQISAFGQIQSAVSTLRDAAKTLANPAIWTTTSATSSDSSAVSFSTSSGASPGSYSVTVDALALSQSVVTTTSLASSKNSIGSGSLTIEVGSWANNTFQSKADTSAVTIDVAATDSLEAVRDKINAAGGGVMASIINDTSGARLVMNSATTGSGNAFRITANDTGDGTNTDANGLSSLAYDPANGTSGTELKQTANNASATINGITVTSGTNKFQDVLTGISFTVGKITPSAVNVSVAQDNNAITKAITDLATSYSALASLLKDNTKYDDSTKTAGTLQGDGTALSLINQFRSTIGASTGASSVFSTLSSVGLEIQSGGTLSVDSAKLTNALGNLAEVKKLFANAGSSGSDNDGIATRIRTLSDNLLSFDGALSTRTTGLKTAISNNNKQQDQLDARATLYEKRLRAQYTALDTTMAGISGQGSYVTQMISAWNKSG